MGARTFDKMPLTVVYGDKAWYQTRVVREHGTVHVVARRAHYPEAPTAGHPDVVKLWEGEAQVVALSSKRWEIRVGDEVFATLHLTSGVCGCSDPIGSWRP